MANDLSARLRYHPTNRIAWATFLPWALVTLIWAALLAAAMYWLFSKGWYLLFLVPTFFALLLSGFVSLTVSKGKCRSPILAAIFGVLVGVILYGGYFYFGMLSMLGVDSAARFDLLPRYILLRL